LKSGQSLDTGRTAFPDLASFSGGFCGTSFPESDNTSKETFGTADTTYVELPADTDHSKSAVGHVDVNSVKKQAYMPPQRAKKSNNTVGNSRTGPFYSNHWLQYSKCAKNKLYNAILRMGLKHPVVLKLGPVTLTNRELAHRLHQLVLGMYGFLIAYAAICGPWALLKCIWRLFVCSVVYGLALTALGWEDQRTPDVLLLSLEMMAEEFVPFMLPYN
jgi:hypothetical protein